MRQPREDTVLRDPWWLIGVITVGALFRLLFRLRFRGTEHIPTKGPALLACNHISVLDPIILALGPSDRGRTVRFLAAAEMFHKPFIGWGLKRIRQIPIHRRASDRAALTEVSDVINRGALAGIFPEGEVGHGPLQPGKRGAARIALTGSVPIVPAAIWGTHHRWPRSRFLWKRPWRPTVAVVFGPPIRPQGDPADQEAVQELTGRIMDGIAKCLEQAQAIAGP